MTALTINNVNEILTIYKDSFLKANYMTCIKLYLRSIVFCKQDRECC